MMREVQATYTGMLSMGQSKGQFVECARDGTGQDARPTDCYPSSCRRCRSPSDRACAASSFSCSRCDDGFRRLRQELLVGQPSLQPLRPPPPTRRAASPAAAARASRSNRPAMGRTTCAPSSTAVDDAFAAAPRSPWRRCAAASPAPAPRRASRLPSRACRASPSRDDVRLDEARRLDAALGADVADRPDDIDDGLGLRLRLVVQPAGVRLREGRDDQRLGARLGEVRRQGSPGRLGDERHVGVQQAQRRVEDVRQHRQRRVVARAAGGTFAISRYQSQYSPQRKSCAWRPASPSWKSASSWSTLADDADSGAT